MENVPGNVDQGDLPKVTIYLQQKLAGDENAWGSMVAHKNDDGTWTVDGAIAQTSELYPEANNQYTYTIDHTGDNVAGSEVTDDNALPRYDENGNLYEYRAIEVIWGLRVNQAASLPIRSMGRTLPSCSMASSAW